MPTNEQWQEAVNWALQQEVEIKEDGVIIAVLRAKDESGNINCHFIVDKVSEYFNVNNIPYDTFSYYDLVPFLN